MSSTVSLLYKQKTSDQLKGIPLNKPAVTSKFKKIWKILFCFVFWFFLLLFEARKIFKNKYTLGRRIESYTWSRVKLRANTCKEKFNFKHSWNTARWCSKGKENTNQDYTMIMMTRYIFLASLLLQSSYQTATKRSNVLFVSL